MSIRTQIFAAPRPTDWSTALTNLGATNIPNTALGIIELYEDSVPIAHSAFVAARVKYTSATSSVTTAGKIGLLGFNDDGTQYGYLGVPGTTVLTDDEGISIVYDTSNNLNDGTFKYTSPLVFSNLGYTRLAVVVLTAPNTNGDETLFSVEVKGVGEIK